MRHAVLGVGGQHARDVDEVRDDRRRGRLGAGAGAVIHRLPHGVAFHEDRIHDAFDVRDQPARRYERRMHAQLDAVGLALGDAQQLDAVAELLGVADVFARELRNAFDISGAELHRDAEADRGHDRELVRRVHAFDVERRIGLRVAAPLRFLQHVGEARAFVAHFGEDEIARAVDDAGDPFDAVRGQPFAQRLDDRYAAADGAFERHHDVLLLRGGENLVAVLREQRLVRGDDVLAVRDGFQDQLARNARAADQLDHDVDVAIRHDFECIGGDGRASPTSARAFSRSLSATIFIVMAQPARRPISS